MYNPRLSNNSSCAKPETAQKTPVGIVDNYPEKGLKNEPKTAFSNTLISRYHLLTKFYPNSYQSFTKF